MPLPTPEVCSTSTEAPGNLRRARARGEAQHHAALLLRHGLDGLPEVHDALVARAAHEDLCLYSFEHGALDFSWGSIDSGHVDVPVGNIASELPQRDITVETWIKLSRRGASHDWAGPVSAAQDDGSIEKGFALSSRCGGDKGPPCDQGSALQRTVLSPTDEQVDARQRVLFFKNRAIRALLQRTV